MRGKLAAMLQSRRSVRILSIANNCRGGNECASTLLKLAAVQLA